MTSAKKGTLKSPHESPLYVRFSHLYDMIFSRLFRERITTVIHSLNIRPGAKVLEVGIGTGLSLAAYPPHCEVTGIDMAPEMLEHARQKIAAHGWRHVPVTVGEGITPPASATKPCLPVSRHTAPQ